MINFRRIPQSIFYKYVTWKGDAVYGRTQWLQRAQKAEEFYYHDVDNTGTTYTSTQLQKIEDNTNIPVSINWLHPITNQKLAILMNARSSFKVISTDARGKLQAQVLDKMKYGIMDTSHTAVEKESMIKDMLVSGMGCIMVVPSTFYQPGMFNLALVSVPWDEVILDINSKRRTLDDMEGFFVEKVFNAPRLLQTYADILSGLTDQDGKPVDLSTFYGQVWVEGDVTDKQNITTTNYNLDPRIIVREYYEKVFTTMYLVPDPKTGLTTFQFE